MQSKIPAPTTSPGFNASQPSTMPQGSVPRYTGFSNSTGSNVPQPQNPFVVPFPQFQTQSSVPSTPFQTQYSIPAAYKSNVSYLTNPNGTNQQKEPRICKTCNRNATKDGKSQCQNCYETKLCPGCDKPMRNGKNICDICDRSQKSQLEKYSPDRRHKQYTSFNTSDCLCLNPEEKECSFHTKHKCDTKYCENFIHGAKIFVLIAKNSKGIIPLPKVQNRLLKNVLVRSVIFMQ